MRRNYQPYYRYDQQVTPQPYSNDSTVRPVHGDTYPQPNKAKPYESKEKYQQHVDKIYAKDHQVTNKDSYSNALWNAAEGHKPVVMTFVRGSDPNSRQHLEAIERAKAASGGKAEFCVIDLDKVDPNSKVGQYALNHIGKEYGAPLTMVFNQKQSESGGTQPERANFWQRGPVNEQALLNGINQASEVQKSRDIHTPRDQQKKESDKPTTPETTSEEAKAKALADSLVKESLKPFDQQKPGELFKDLDQAARMKACWDAIKAADEASPLLGAKVRATIGLSMIQWGSEAQQAKDFETAQKRYLWGAEFIQSGGMKNPEMYHYPSFQKALRDSQLPGQSAEYLLNQGLQNPSWSAPTAEEIRQNPKAAEEKREWARKQIIEEMKKPRLPRK